MNHPHASRLHLRIFRPTNAKRVLFFLLIDLFLSYFTLSLAYNLRFSFQVPLEFSSDITRAFVVIIALKIIFLAFWRVYLVPWRFFGLSEGMRIFYAHICAYGIFFFTAWVYPSFFGDFPLSVGAIDFILSMVFIGTIRIAKRIYIENTPKNSPLPALIFGANAQASTLIKSALSGELPYYPLGIVDKDSKVQGTYISNLKVSSLDSAKDIMDKYHIKVAILTKNYAKPPLETLFNQLKDKGFTEIKIANFLSDNNENTKDNTKQVPLKDISIEDLLSRPVKDLDKEVISQFINHKTILITGAGGSIGSEIVRQCIKFGAKRVILVDHSEYNLYAITEEISAIVAPNLATHTLNKQTKIRPCLLSILEKQDLFDLINEEKPDIIFHAAAYKHVPLCEFNPKAAVENNVLGSKNVIDCAIALHTPKVVIVSTDKAVRPTNIMGATKRVVELYAQNVLPLGVHNSTEIVAVRFGNVLGSSGSVVPKFKAQIAKGGPITVTHPDITRYFMLIPEACQLVLQAGAIAKGGEIFILDMGEPVKILDLAKNMLKLYGKEDEIKIEFSGLRVGEKLYEELLLDEGEQKTRYKSIQVARATPYEIKELNTDIHSLLNAPIQEIPKVLLKIVKEFKHNREHHN